jgi:sugar phosphate permease
MDEGEARLRRRQALTVSLMVSGYTGYYLCRSNFSVGLPQIIEELAARGFDPGSAKIRLGAIASAGTLAYALGKPLAGALAHFLGGRGDCLLSLGLTLLRETFNTWTPTYFVEGVGLSRARAAGTSVLFPRFGGVSAPLAGVLGDRLGQPGRVAVVLFGQALAAGALAALGGFDFGGSTRWPVMLVTAVSFLLLGPYSYLAGAIALDFGAKNTTL